MANKLGDAKDAQVGAKEVQEPHVLVLPKDSTRPIEMSTKELISEFRSENPRVVKVQALLDNPRAVLVSGVGPGSTRVFITDVKKNTESLEVRVPLDEEAEREAKRLEIIEQIHRSVPTAAVDVVVSGHHTVILNGTVPHAESVQVISERVRGVFGPAANIVNAMRIGGVQQVLIEVTIARVNRSKIRNIGFSWLETGQQHFVASSIQAGNLAATSTLPSILAPAASLAASPNAVFGIFNDKQGFFGYLTALTTENVAKVIAEPRVMTLSGRPAWIVSGGETPILTTSGTGAPSVTYKTFGTVVNFLPIVLGNGKIHLEVRPEISALNAALGITLPGATATNVPGFDLRSAQVAVEMEDGQTLAIGGLIQNNINAQNSKVPILGDIPFLAFAFTSKTYTETEEELVILVTPHLIDPMACCQIPKYLPGRETRTPDDFELFLEGILEAPRGQRSLTHPYTAAYLNGPTTKKYPCGDASGGNCLGDPKACATGACNPTPPAGGAAAPAAAPQKAAPQKMDARTVGDTVPETPAAAPATRYIREPAPTAPAPAATPANLPMLPPVTSLGAPTETHLPPAGFGTAVLTDR